MQLSKGLLQYMQASFALGFLSIANDLINILHVYLVNPTYGSERYHKCPAAHEVRLKHEDAELGWIPAEWRVLGILLSQSRPVHLENFSGEPPKGTPDHLRTRFWARRFTDLMALAFLGASISGAIVNGKYSTMASSGQSRSLMALRWVLSFFFF